MTSTYRRRVERLESQAGARNPVRIVFHKPGEIVPPGTRLVTFTIDKPTAERREDEDAAPTD